jgi:hypothetical protein
MNKEKAVRQVHSTNQLFGSPKEDKNRKVIALINELQLQDSSGPDDDLSSLSASKTVIIYKLAQVPTDIWMDDSFFRG